VTRRENHLLDAFQRQLGMVPLFAVAATSTAKYTKSRIANAGMSRGGAATSRGAVVNAGGV
jgi:hypothetical protein